MKKIFLAFIILFGFLNSGFSMNDGDSIKKGAILWKENHYIDLSMDLGESVVYNSLQWDKLFAIARNRIKIGFGARFNVGNYWNKSFYTAPPQRIGGAFDTLTIQHQIVYSLNLQFVFDVPLLKWWDVGMNIDLVGVSWGPTAPASYYSYATGNNGSTQNVSPENFNLMLFGHNDFGNLNSQFYMRFWPSNNVCIKAGMGLATFISHTDVALNNGNNRFNAGSYMGFISLGWTPGRNELNADYIGRRKLITPVF